MPKEVSFSGAGEASITIAFEEHLTKGALVEARWTNSNRILRAKARVVRVNRASIVVTLLEDVERDGGHWEAGQTFPIPRFFSKTWSQNNRVAPLEGAL